MLSDSSTKERFWEKKNICQVCPTKGVGPEAMQADQLFKTCTTKKRRVLVCKGSSVSQLAAKQLRVETYVHKKKAPLGGRGLE